MPKGIHNHQHQVGYIQDTFSVDPSVTVFRDSQTGEVLDRAEVAKRVSDSDGEALPKSIIVDIEGTHTGITKNWTEYISEKMKQSAPSWTSPYNKPVLREHNRGGKALGRVKGFEYKKSVLKKDAYTIQLTLEITDPETIKDHLNGTALTYSIGGIASEAFCSICGIDILNSDDWCGHWKGRIYSKRVGKGKNAKETKERCIWQIGVIDYIEVSVVNVPADEYAQVLTINVKEENAKESLEEETEEEGSIEQKDELDEGLAVADSVLGTSEESEEEHKEEQEDEGEEDAKDKEDEEEGSKEDDEESSSESEESVDQAAQIEALTEELNKTKEQLTSVTAELNDTKEKLKDAEDKADEIQKSSEQTFKTSVTIAKSLKRVYADYIVDTKIALGDIEESAREGEISQLVVKSAKALSDNLQELRTALKVKNSLPPVTQGDVGTEGALGVPQDRVDVDDANRQKTVSKIVTAEDAVQSIVNANVRED